MQQETFMFMQVMTTSLVTGMEILHIWVLSLAQVLLEQQMITMMQMIHLNLMCLRIL